MAYKLGNTVTSWCEFRLLDVTDLPTVRRDLTNPTSIVVTVTNPAAVVTYPAAVNVRTGVYYVSVLLNVVGTWTIAWVGSGAATGVAPPQVINVTA